MRSGSLAQKTLNYGASGLLGILVDNEVRPDAVSLQSRPLSM
jgi:hypothetical protein